MPQVIATPLNGARVRKPDGQLLKADGEPVEREAFWLRRQSDGDVALSDVVDTPADAPKSKK